MFFVVYCLLVVFSCVSLFVVCWLCCVGCCCSFVDLCVLLVVCWSLFVTLCSYVLVGWLSRFIATCVLFGVCCSILFVGCCVLFVVCCLLFVGCCSVCVCVLFVVSCCVLFLDVRGCALFVDSSRLRFRCVFASFVVFWYLLFSVVRLVWFVGCLVLFVVLVVVYWLLHAV